MSEMENYLNDIGALYTEEDQKNMVFEEAFRAFNAGDVLFIFRNTELGIRQTLDILPYDELAGFSLEDLILYMRDKYLRQKNLEQGKFIIQLKQRNKDGKQVWGKSTMLNIVDPNYQAPEKEKNNGESQFINKLFERLERLEERISVKPEMTEEKFLDNILKYKQIFGGGESNLDMTKIYSDMARLQKESFNLGLQFQNPSKDDKPGIEKYIPVIGEALSGLVGKFTQKPANIYSMQQVRQAAGAPVAPPVQNPTYQPEAQIEENSGEDEQMKIAKGLILLQKVKKTAKVEDKEEREQKIETIALDIIDFFEEIAQFAEMDLDLDVLIAEQAPRYGVSLNDTEKQVVKDVAGKIKDILKAGEGVEG